MMRSNLWKEKFLIIQRQKLIKIQVFIFDIQLNLKAPAKNFDEMVWK